MKDIAAHVMDIVQNSITAGSSEIGISLAADLACDTLALAISDNGKGMSEDMLRRVTSPFTTTRTTRKVGLGIPLLKAGVENTGGRFEIKSKLGIGTEVFAEYKLSHLDRPPIGDMAGVISTLVLCNEVLDFKITARCDVREFLMDTKEIKNTLEGVPFSEPAVAEFIIGYLKEGLEEVFKGEFE